MSTSSQGLPLPTLDIATRSNSTFAMLESLKLFKPFCEQNMDASIKLCEVDWSSITELVKTLKLLQNQLYLGDFY